MPAEAYLNTANALNYLQKYTEALHYAQKADTASQAAIMALTEVQKQVRSHPKIHSASEAESLILQQLDIRILSLLSKGQIMEQTGQFKQAIRELSTG